jgi:pyruvate dehydrogenase E2 component (dihydrolipoamide acetyltransferase)
MATEVKLPALGENISGGDVSDVKVAPGDGVTQGQTLLEVEAEKSSIEVPAPLTGKILKVLIKKGDSIKTGQALFLIEEMSASTADGAKKASAPAKAEGGKMRDDAIPPAAPMSAAAVAVKAPATAEPTDDARLVPAGPATRRLARELGVELARVRGSGPGGRVIEEDVKAFAQGGAPNRGGGSPGVAVPPLPDFSKWGAVEKRPLDSVRRKTAEHMSLSWSQIPHVTQHDLADITELEAFRKERDGKGPKLTVTAFALKAAAIALAEFPTFNASLDQAAGQLIVKRYCHIGVAVDAERGLLVPVLRDVNAKSVRALAQELADVADKARQKKLGPDDLRGGTFTITNLGGIGGIGFTPIINYPEVAILGLSRGRLQPVFQGNAFVPRLLLPLSLSYDHRVIDGAAAARFTRRIVELLEKPLVMLLDA